jgi:hypothetical protein
MGGRALVLASGIAHMTSGRLAGAWAAFTGAPVASLNLPAETRPVNRQVVERPLAR